MDRPLQGRILPGIRNRPNREIHMVPGPCGLPVLLQHVVAARHQYIGNVRHHPVQLPLRHPFRRVIGMVIVQVHDHHIRRKEIPIGTVAPPVFPAHMVISRRILHHPRVRYHDFRGVPAVPGIARTVGAANRYLHPVSSFKPSVKYRIFMSLRSAFPISALMPSDSRTSEPNTQTSSHFPRNTRSMNIASSRSSPSSMNCGRSRCGASGIAPLSTAKRLKRLALCVFPLMSPAYGEQIYTSGLHLRRSLSMWEIASYGTGSE